MAESNILIGYRLNDAIAKLPHDKEIIVEVTKAPSKGGADELDCSNPIVINHREDDKRVVLTVSCFK